MQHFSWKYLVLAVWIFIPSLPEGGVNYSFKTTFAQAEDTATAKWYLVSSPIKNSLNYIHMLSANRGYISGKFFLEYNGKAWKLSASQPPFYIDNLFISETNELWATSNTATFEAVAMRFTGRSWEKIYHPFTNQINCMCILGNGDAWLGGDREIAYYNKKNSLRIAFPANLSFIRCIYGINKNSVWANTADDKLFFYSNNKWQKVLDSLVIKYISFDSPNHGYALTDKSILEFKDSKWKTHSSEPLLKDITKIVVTENRSIWGIGSNGLVMHYNNGHWRKQSVPTNENLLAIDMLSDTEGWITGSNGLILHYTKQVNSGVYQDIEFGFETRRAYNVGKEVDDEYGVAIEDINADGLKDIIAVCLYEPGRVYINRTTGPGQGINSNFVNFSEEASERGISGLTGTLAEKNLTEIYMGIGMADIDNDKDQDVYLCDLADKNKIFLNNGKGYFRNVSHQANRGIGEKNRTNASIFGDVDNDGDLDMFITSEYGTNRLFINNGCGYFTDETNSAGLVSEGGSMGASFGDLDNDGKIDLYVCNWAKTNILYKNITSAATGIKFENITQWAGAGGDAFTKSNGVCLTDIDNDGDLDLFVTNRKTSNRLYTNNGKGLFTDITESAIGIDTLMSYGASFADFNNDGWPDLYVANVGENQLYKNINGKKFIRVTSEMGDLNKGYYTGTAAGDIDNDGDIDLYSACYIGASSILFLNNLNNKNFIVLELEGTLSNRDAVGAKVWIYESSHIGDIKYLKGFREINSGCGYVSHNSKEVHFGVAPGLEYDIVVVFPASGIEKVITGITPGQRLVIYEEEGFQAWMTLNKKALFRFVIDQEVHYEGGKLLIVLFFIFLSILRGRRKYQWPWQFQLILHPGILIIYIIPNIIFSNQQIFLSDVVPISSALVSMLVFHLVNDKMRMAKLARQEKQETRDRIARDLHDDLASTISTSLIYTDALRRSVNNSSTSKPELVDKINKLLGEAADTITDIVWTVSPKYDHLNDLLLRLNIMISETCQAGDILYEYCNNVPGEKTFDISSEVKRNVFLIFKEALNNAAKYSGAGQITFTAGLKKEELELSIHDNGVGFYMQKTSLPEGNKVETGTCIRPLYGQGISNMILRAKEIKAELLIDSAPGSGTTILLRKKMT